MNDDKIIKDMIDGVKKTEQEMASKNYYCEDGEVYHVCVMTDKLFKEITSVMCRDPRSTDEGEHFSDDARF